MKIQLQTLILIGIIFISIFITDNFYLFHTNENESLAGAVPTSVASKKQLNSANILNSLSHLPKEATSNILIAKTKIANSISSNVDVKKTISNISKKNYSYSYMKQSIKEQSAINNVSNEGSCLSAKNYPTADIFLAENIKNGEIFYQKNIFHRWPIASISKLMASIVVMNNYDFSKSVEITKSIIKDVYPYNTFRAGERYSVNDLVRASVVRSSNDAVYALANMIGVKKFVQDMNGEAKKIGMRETTFSEPSGLSYLNQSTATDLYKLIKYIYNKYPRLLETTRKKYIYVYDLANHKKRKLENIDRFSGLKNFYGGKTGYIDESGQNLLTLFQKNGKIIAIMVLGSTDRFGDVDKIYNCIK